MDVTPCAVVFSIVSNYNNVAQIDILHITDSTDGRCNSQSINTIVYNPKVYLLTFCTPVLFKYKMLLYEISNQGSCKGLATLTYGAVQASFSVCCMTLLKFS